MSLWEIYKAKRLGYADDLWTSLIGKKLGGYSWLSDYETTPYLYRAMPNLSHYYNREIMEEVVGGSVGWNQWLQNPSTATDKGITLTNNGDGSVTINGTNTGSSSALFSFSPNVIFASGHKMLLVGSTSMSGWDSFTLYNDAVGAGSAVGNKGYSMFTANGNLGCFNIAVWAGVAVDNVKVYPQLFDLTQMFGSTIADYIYSLEQGTAGAGVAWFKKLFPKPYYAYNAGELMHVSGVSSHDMVGFNQSSEAFELNKVWNDSGVYVTGSQYYTASPQKIRVIPNTTYCFAMPNISAAQGFFYYKEFDANGDFIRGIATTNAVALDTKYTTFTTSADAYYIGIFLYRSTAWTSAEIEDICINLSWDGSRNGEYEPYQKWSYPLDSDLELRGIPKIENGNLYYDGDVYEADGTVTRKYGVVDLGSLNWGISASDRFYNSTKIANFKYATTTDERATGIECSKYAISTNLQYSENMDDKSILRYNNATFDVVVKDHALDGYTAEQVKTAMSGVYLIYELATPTTETAQPFTKTQLCDSGGTEEFVTSGIVSVGHKSKYAEK